MLLVAIAIFALLLFSVNFAPVIGSCSVVQKAYHNMVYDSENDRMIVYGGITKTGYDHFTDDTVTYDFNSNTWEKITANQYPYQKTSMGMAYDSESNKTIIYGGSPEKDVASNQTWVFDSNDNTWVNAAPTTNPGLRGGVYMVYDSESDVIVLFCGGLDEDANPLGVSISYNDTWVFNYNANTWTNVTPAISPPGRHSFGIAYDSESDRVIIFGGFLYGSGGYFADEYYSKETWAFDYNSNSWENLTTSSGPDGRTHHNMAYDSESDRIIMFGGYHYADDSYGDETWSFDYNSNTWTQKDALGTSPFKYKQSMAYDSESDKIIIFGGSSTSVYDISDETWTYDYNSDIWTFMECIIPTETPLFLYSTVVSLNLLATLVVIRRRNK